MARFPRKIFQIGLPLACIAALVLVPAFADSESDDDTAQGWTPSQASAWTRIQMDYAAAVKQYGENSPEATDAQVRMNTFARKLGIKAPTEAPQQAATEPPVDYEAKEQAELDAQAKNSPPLNAPAPEHTDPASNPPVADSPPAKQ